MNKRIGQRNGVGSRGRRGVGAHRGPATLAHCRKPVKDSRPLSSGFSLLEIILALAILAGSLAALGEVMRLADQNAAFARDETQAQILASSIMDELVSGARELMAINQAQVDYEMEDPWLYSVAIEQTGYVELVAVRVAVQEQVDERLQPARFELIRWLPNPDYVPATTTSQSSSSSSSSGSSGFGATGGQQ